ncbi:MAG: hypothetical protein ACJAX8_000979 [Flavobacteriales bacterium]
MCPAFIYKVLLCVYKVDVGRVVLIGSFAQGRGK